jgi:aminoglycoside phosphotransferase (APT) family kinase protein
MNSISKTPVSLAQAREIAQKHLHQPVASLTELSDGFFNATYRLDLADGTIRVLKVAPLLDVQVLRYERNIMQAEVGALRLARAHTQMPVPEIFFHDTSRAILPTDYFIMSFVPGVSFWNLRKELPEAAQVAIEEQVGRYLCQVNAIQGQKFGYFAAEKQFDSWPACFDAMLEGVLQDGEAADVHLPMPNAELLALARSKYAALAEVTAPHLVHWDLWDGNIFIDPASHNITGIIDFERALWGDPLMEVNFGGLGDQPHFRAGYGLDLLSQPGAATRRMLYNLYLYLIMVIECTYRRYETHDQENWARGMLSAELEKLKDAK